MLSALSRNRERGVVAINVQQCRLFLFLNLRRYDNGKTANSSISTIIHCIHLTTVLREKPSNIYNNLYCQKLESLTYIFAADSTGLY